MHDVCNEYIVHSFCRSLTINKITRMQSVAESNDYHHGSLKQALFESALRHLRQTGADRLSLRALAREIGVSQTAPYRHFKDKTALLQALAIEGYRTLRASNLAAVKIAGDDLRTALRAAARSYIQFSKEHAELFDLMFGSLVRNRENPQLDEAGAEALAVVSELMELGIRQGVLQKKGSHEMAETAWALAHGFATIFRNKQASLDFDVQMAHVELAFDLLFDGLCVDPAPV